MLTNIHDDEHGYNNVVQPPETIVCGDWAAVAPCSPSLALSTCRGPELAVHKAVLPGRSVWLLFTSRKHVCFEQDQGLSLYKFRPQLFEQRVFVRPLLQHLSGGGPYIFSAHGSRCPEVASEFMELLPFGK